MAIHNPFSQNQPHPYPRSTWLVFGVTIAASYLVPRLTVLATPNPAIFWPVWPGCAILVTGLLLVPLRVWPLLIPACFAVFALADLQAGEPFRAVAWFIPGNTVEVLIAALGLRYSFGGVPRLDSLKSLAKYSIFAIVLAPCAAAFLSAQGIGPNYWNSWRIAFLSEVLAFITITPAILSWVNDGRALVRKPAAYHLEGMVLIAGLVILSYLALASPENLGSPALLYSLVPLLLWSTLRFGWVGITTSVVIVTSLSIWAALRGRGPFSHLMSVIDVLSLQGFLIFATAPFMVLAALVEERKLTQEELRTGEEKLRLLLESTAEAIYGIDLQGQCTFCNPTCLRLLGYGNADELLGQDMHDLIHHHGSDRTPSVSAECSIFEAVRLGAAVHSDDVVLWRADGTSFPAEYWSHPQRRGDDVVGTVVAFIDITGRKLAEEALRESEQRFRLAAQAGKMYSFEWDVNTNEVVRSAEGLKILGVAEPLRTTQQEFVRRMHPEDRSAFVATIAGLTPENPTGIVTFRAVASDGAVVWLRSCGRAFFDDAGKMLRVVGMVADISDLKRAEDALAGMTRKLIESQEQERARIGRELHDDINQRLAMLALELGQLEDNPSEVRGRAQELRKQTAEISDDVQALSHELHSSKLEYLGAIGGIKSWCKEFGERHGIQIDFTSPEATISLPSEIGLCLFRVLQEALHNAAKHSGVKRMEVQLREDSGEIHLLVSDLGRGFDWETAMQGRGLGLMSMQERVRLVNGTIEIQSKPMGGTTIVVRVPLRSEPTSRRVAG